jgi:ABC-type microcin C transport system duplicated ATPase subunit YejF
MPPEAHGSAPDRSHTKDKLHKKYSFTNYAVPTGALDYNTSKDILRLIETVNQKYGNTIVMVTHNDAIKDMADRVVKLRDGMIRKNYTNEQKVPAMELEW